MIGQTEDEVRFWEHAEPLLASGAATRSTMMGLPCLRVNELFFASWDRSNGALLVKLPEARETEAQPLNGEHRARNRGYFEGS